MKKIILLLTILISAQAGFCATDKVAAIKDSNASYKTQYEICSNIAQNFKEHGQMALFIRNECTLYQMRRQRVLPLLFPMTSNNGAEYKANYKALEAEYANKLDNAFINSLKEIVEEYCKNNSFRYVKKDPKACTRVNDLFREF